MTALKHLGQYLFGSLGFGGVYALASLGLVLIFKTSGVINFAFGALATMVTFLLWAGFYSAGLPLAVAWVLAALAAVAIGVVTELTLLERLRRAAVLIQIVLTLGLLLFVQGLTGLIFGFAPKGIPTVLGTQSVGGGGFYIQRNDIFIVGLTAVVGVALYVLFERTRGGLAMRAVAADRDVAALMGIPVRRYLVASWGGGVLITSLAAILVAPSVGLTPTMMDNISVFAFAAAVLGGFGSLLGAVVGGFAIAAVSNLIAAYLSTNYQLTLVFALILVVLYLRPQGLFGRPEVSRL